MGITAYKILVDGTTDGLEAKVRALINADADYLLYGPPTFSSGTRQWAQTLIKGSGIAEGGGNPAASDITDVTDVGQALITAVNAAAARGAIGAGTSNLVLGTTDTTAKPGDWQPELTDIQGMSATGRNIAEAANYAAVRGLLDLGEFATVDAAAAAALLNLGALATLDNVTLSAVTDAGALAGLDTVTMAMIEDAAAFGRTLLAAVNAATGRNLLELGQLATLNEVTASQISDNTITNGEVSPNAGIAATKIAVAAGANGLAGGDLQAALQSLAARIDALEP